VQDIETVEVEMPEPAKSFLRFGGSAIAIFGTSSLVFWELASKKHLRQKPQPQLLLSSGQSLIPDAAYYPNNSQPGGYARGAYDWGKNYSRGVTPAMENGASAAIATLGTVANHSNPFRPWRSFAFWSMGIGTLVVGGWVTQFFLGGLIATRNPRQLPQNAPTAVRFGHGVVNAGKPVASGVWSGFGQVANVKAFRLLGSRM
jgi:hypothetical protein